ncbi:uncharacterized protein Z519_03283 [Cladophialophora bantiana CBS 173.52]|uniref:Zn(2)-C6 fungal-type domain-containing protein n=1 Tax=Cladophialophora bantiana (strain ATCC 10958 / CBS 173.52 / CDC B-1940 / NIH 8579) TaxID=1442370 RepID=A0A0D2HZ81_CLAB1|nr:uncharacterized protein Z519_03283 [Cladophialophora bantiana CBS 173.52]KIW96215.1 hypothetical protein Z519_03283 [Cladophialophora bantiana CBS 173.52]
MAGAAGGRDQPSNDPTSSFAGSAPSHFPSPYYPIDTELTSISPNYSMPPYARPMEEGVTSVDKINHGAMNNLPMGPNGAAASSAPDPAMAPPQTPNQPTFASAGTRASVDTSSETPQEAQTGDKRKRSKASRACDECRRKKVKCDAPTELDGTPKTCTNCQKAGVNCEFERKPMKRGPSKGYISALAERVHGLEQKQRQSLDAGPVGFAETFSPDEPSGPGFNRASSFSAPTTVNPFSRAEFQRDRIPSTGGWGISSIASSLRPRASGSLAIAPNETLSPAALLAEEEVNSRIQYRDPTKTFWSQIRVSRPAKRPRIQGPNEDMEPFKLDEASLAKYYEQYHPLFPLLPERMIVDEVVANANFEMQQAFTVAVDLLPDLRAGVTLNGTHDSSSLNNDVDPAISRPTSTLKSTLFENYDKLAAYLFDQVCKAADHLVDHNLTLLWTLVLVMLTCEYDVKRIEDGGASSRGRQFNVNLCRFVLNQVQRDIAHGSTTVISDLAGFTKVLNMAMNCVRFMFKYHALGEGTHPSAMPSAKDLRVQDFSVKALPIEAAYIAISSNQLELLADILVPRKPNSAGARMALKALSESAFDLNVGQLNGSPEDSVIYKQLNWFRELLMSPYQDHEPALPSPILDCVDKLTIVLIEEANATANAPRYNPLDLHTWSVATITLCEFVTDLTSKPAVKFARERLEEFRKELQKKSDVMHKHYGFEWFFGGKMTHWADALLAMIDYVQKHPSAADEATDETDLFVPTFTGLMEKGWLHALFYFARE